MIISEYIWHRWLATQPNPERIDKVLDETLLDKDPNKYHPMYRKRKQVSSHIQVQKSFFKYHPACELASFFLFASCTSFAIQAIVLVSSVPRCVLKGGEAERLHMTLCLRPFNLPLSILLARRRPNTLVTPNTDISKAKT